MKRLDSVKHIIYSVKYKATRRRRLAILHG